MLSKKHSAKKNGADCSKDLAYVHSCKRYEIRGITKILKPEFANGPAKTSYNAQCSLECYERVKGIHNYVKKANISVYRHQWFVITQY